LQIYLTRSGVDQIGTAHNMIDSLRRIINDNGELIRPETIGAL
jgi:hypothetical protein